MKRKRTEILCLETDESDDDENSEHDLVHFDEQSSDPTPVLTFVPHKQIPEVKV